MAVEPGCGFAAANNGLLADVSYVLRLLGDRPVTLDAYADRTYMKGLIPENASRGELSL
ncbi:hypothetical protein JAO32_19825, partial [Terriglobus sp. ADX1]